MCAPIRVKVSTLELLLRSCAIALLCTLNACAVSPGKAGEPGALRAAGVVHVGTRDELKGSDDYKELIANGVPEASIVDGSLLVVRLLCCRDNIKASSPAVVYNPQAIKVMDGDIVEFRVGGAKTQNPSDQWNVLTRVLQATGQTPEVCWWEPRNDQLWMRYAYCEWMQKDGWVRQDAKMNPAWYKPAENSAAK
jgi:hypothetical protein